MLLTAGNTSVELRVVGWESALEADDHRDLTDWLEVVGVVNDSTSTRTYDVSLDAEDALRMATWLREAADKVKPSAGGSREHALLSFAEPGFAVELVSRHELSVVTHWFSYERVGHVFELLSFNARIACIDCSRADLRFVAEAWADELAPFAGSEKAVALNAA